MKLYTLEYSFNKPMQQTITVGTNTEYMIGVSAVKNGELLDLHPQDVTLTIGENVLTSDKLINGYVVFDYSQGRRPVSEIVKVTILDTQFELLIVGKFSSKGDVGGSGGVAEETDPVFVEKCLSASSVILGLAAKGNEYGQDYVVVIGPNANGLGSDRGVFIGNSVAGEYTTKPDAPMSGAPFGAVCIGTTSLVKGPGNFYICANAKCDGTKDIAIGFMANNSANNSIAIGDGTNCTGLSAIVIGTGAKTESEGAIAIGEDANASYSSVAIGRWTNIANSQGVAIGTAAKVNGNFSIAIGNSTQANKDRTIQLGSGSNNTYGTFQVWDHTLLNKETGLIPPERLGTGYDSSQRQVLVNNYGTLTWETYNG